MKRIQSLYS